MDPRVARKNAIFGLALFGLFCLLFLGTFLIAVLYLAAD